MESESGSALQTARQGAGADAQLLQQLMLGYQRADRDATAMLIERLSPMLLRFLSGPMQTRTLAEDMLQECWLRIHKARHTYRPDAPVLPWVFAIARYTRIDVYRRRRKIDSKELTGGDFSEWTPEAATPAPAMDLDLWRLVEQLPKSQREVIRMLKISGMSLQEVARATGSTVGAVKQKAHRAYNTLRSLLQTQPAARTEP